MNIITEQRGTALQLFKQGFNVAQVVTYTNVDEATATEWQKEFDYIENRLQLLYMLLAYDTQKSNMIFSIADRIWINQERARLMRDEPVTEPYAYNDKLLAKINFTLGKLQ